MFEKIQEEFYEQRFSFAVELLQYVVVKSIVFIPLCVFFNYMLFVTSQSIVYFFSFVYFFLFVYIDYLEHSLIN